MARPRRPAPHVVLDDDQRQRLERLSRARKLPRRLVQRAKILLECAAGLPDSQVAVRLGISAQTVAKWRKRFLERGLEGLRDNSRTGRGRLVTDQEVARIIAKTLSPPPGSARWTAATMAAATGWSVSTIRRKWRQIGLRLDRLVCVRVNSDLLRYGTWSVAGVHQDPGWEAVAISVNGQWSEAVPPFVWGQEVPQRCLPAPSGPDCASDDHSPAGEGNAGGFEDFLDAVVAGKRDDQALFLLVSSSSLHRAALLHQWRVGRVAMHVSHAISAEAWYEVVRRLADMMAQRQRHCGAHGDDHEVAMALEAPEPGYVVWPDCHDAAQEGDACQCRLLRQSLIQAAKQPWHKKKLRYRKCRCNSSECANCCLRRYWYICSRLHRDWRGAFGDGQVLSLTLTYRASSALTPEEWLKRAHRDLVSLRARWRHGWGAMPPHLWSREFTTGDTPHFHILMPWEGSEYLKSLRRWLRTCWASITGASRNLRTGYAHLVKVLIKDNVEDAIQYLMKSVAFPRANRPVPPGTPSFRSWGCSQRWDLAQRPTRLANSN